MADCKVCGGWFSSSDWSQELCPTCERALKRLNGYAVPVVRCRDCVYSLWLGRTTDGIKFDIACGKNYMQITEESFCSYGKRREENAAD